MLVVFWRPPMNGENENPTSCVERVKVPSSRIRPSSIYAERSCDRLRSPTARCNIYRWSSDGWSFGDTALELVDVLMSVIIVADAIPE